MCFGIASSLRADGCDVSHRPGLATRTSDALSALPTTPTAGGPKACDHGSRNGAGFLPIALAQGANDGLGSGGKPRPDRLPQAPSPRWCDTVARAPAPSALAATGSQGHCAPPATRRTKANPGSDQGAFGRSTFLEGARDQRRASLAYGCSVNQRDKRHSDMGGREIDGGTQFEADAGFDIGLISTSTPSMRGVCSPPLPTTIRALPPRFMIMRRLARSTPS